MRKTCNYCDDMMTEPWPHGAVAVRCMSNLPPIGSVMHYGRTMQVFELGTVGEIQRPAWCPRQDK